MVEEDGVGPVVLLDVINLLDNLVVGLVPGDALPLVLAALAGATQGPLQAVGMVDGLHHVKAAHAQLAAVERGQRVALDAGELALLVDVEQHAAAVVATRGRPVVGTGDGEVTLLPTPLALVIGLTIY